MKDVGFFTLTAIIVCMTGRLFSSMEAPPSPILPTNNYKQTSYSRFSSLIQSAEEVAECKMYSLAIPAYTHALQSFPGTNTSLKTSLTLRVAQLYLLVGQPERTIDLLQKLVLGTAEPERNTLIALSYIHLNQPEEAIKHLSTANKSHEILLAMAYELLGNDEKAIESLQKIQPEENSFPLSRVLFSKIAMDNGSYQSAYEQLQSLSKMISPDHPLYPEVLWMMGTAQYKLDNIAKSIIHFEEALTLPSFQAHDWYSSCIGQLTDVYLAECNNPNRSMKEKDRLLSRAEQMVQEEHSRHPSDNLTIALAKISMTKNYYFPSEETLSKCETLLCQSDHFTTKTAKTEALLLQAQIATDYSQREKHLNTLTSEHNNTDSHITPYGWLLRGHNERDESYHAPPQETRYHLEKALTYYKKAYLLMKKSSSPITHQALRSWAQTAHDLQDVQQLKKTYEIVTNNLNNEDSKAENYYIKSLIATHIYNLNGHGAYLQEAIHDLQKGLKESPSDKETLQLSLLLGKVYFLRNSFEEAESVLAPLTDTLSATSLTAESLYWCGRSAEMFPGSAQPARFYYKRCYTEYPSSPFAAEAFFRMYTYQEYLHGEKEAKKHLEELVTRYPDSPYIMDAFFLLGLDSKRDRKTAKGKWISKSNLTQAIDLFQEVSTEYERFKTNNLLTNKEIAHYSSLELRATLEKALCNLAIARLSSGAKKHIYLKYSEEVFNGLIERIGQPDINDHKHDTLEEAMYGLAQTQIEAKQYDEAEETVKKVIFSYESSKITRGYYLSRSWHDLSVIALARPQNIKDDSSQYRYQEALSHLHHAEECAKGRVLSTDQTIDLWLKISHCHKMMGQYDQAMRYLTKAIDEDAISNLRIKAMFLRAEIYKLQGRMELSRKQLEATSKKGGEWGQKAKDKLGEIYGYH